MPLTHADKVREMKRLNEMVDANSCTLADSPLELPASLYLDPDYWAREVDELFQKRPIVVALSCELPGPNTYVTLENVPGFRIVATRDADGVAHAFFNSCRHRGAPVASGRGKGSRFSCPYHAWTYSNKGQLVGISAERLFGDCEKSGRGLVEIRVQERHGLIFGVLDPEVQFDLDGFLGDFDAELESIGLGNMHYMWSHSFEGPNWKYCKDGFIENYHFATVHAESLPNLIGNVNVTDMWGIHSRMLLPDKGIHTQRERPEAEWDFEAAFATVYYMFPNTMIASCWGKWPLVTRLYPGMRPDQTTCVQTLLTTQEPTEAVREEAKSFEGIYKQITQNEDFVLDFAIQHAAENSGNDSYLLGRNECALQHFHKSIATMVPAPSG